MRRNPGLAAREKLPSLKGEARVAAAEIHAAPMPGGGPEVKQNRGLSLRDQACRASWQRGASAAFVVAIENHLHTKGGVL